jgi:hypothetical protein
LVLKKFELSAHWLFSPYFGLPCIGWTTHAPISPIPSYVAESQSNIHFLASISCCSWSLLLISPNNIYIFKNNIFCLLFLFFTSIQITTPYLIMRLSSTLVNIHQCLEFQRCQRNLVDHALFLRVSNLLNPIFNIYQLITYNSLSHSSSSYHFISCYSHSHSNAKPHHSMFVTRIA